jgi:hypothetical protein
VSNFKRRYDYGTSEAMLYARHPSVTKRFPWQTAGLVLIALGVAGLATRSLTVLPLGAMVLLLEGIVKKRYLQNKFGIRLALTAVIRAAAKSHGTLAYYLSYFWIRYFLAASVMLTAVFPSIWLLMASLAILPTMVEYFQKRPLLPFPVFWLFFWMEQLFYQIGVVCGCWRAGNWRLYGIRFIRSGSRRIGRFSFLNRLKMRLRSGVWLSPEKG